MMSMMGMEILVSEASNSRLLSNTSQPYLILNLIGSYFLLTKASPKETFGKNINFEVQGREFYSTFTRHVNLTYAGKLSELAEILSIDHNAALQHQWLMLYEIHDYVPFRNANFKLGIPPYGGEIKILTQKYGPRKSRVSNLFRLNGQSFYFLQCNSQFCEEFSPVTDLSATTLFGITYFVKDVCICLPFHSIASQKACPMNILHEIRPILEGTCYISFMGNYCTGFVLNQKTVISARHVLPFEEQTVGKQVEVRLYPFHQEKSGQISRIGQGSVDVLVIEIQDKLIVRSQTANLEPGTSLKMKVDDKIMGKEVLAVGFGKYGFSSKIFHKIEVAMPTIESGVISKVINLGHSHVFLKTDASLYNGFSGCGIWMGESLIGMAIFILKNKSNQSNFNRHNFSYALSFILDLLRKDTREYLISQINAQLNYFDRIQTRHRLTLLPKM